MFGPAGSTQTLSPGPGRRAPTPTSGCQLFRSNQVSVTPRPTHWMVIVPAEQADAAAGSAGRSTHTPRVSGAAAPPRPPRPRTPPETDSPPHARHTGRYVTQVAQ